MFHCARGRGLTPANAGVVGVFAGTGGNVSSYAFSDPHVWQSLRGQTAGLEHVASDKDFLATRVSYKLGLEGPSIGVQTSTSTALVAIHLACKSLLDGECDVALAGGVSVRFPASTGYLYEEGGVNSQDGRCRPFDANANGTVFASGVGVVVLRRLDDARARGNRIRAVVLGSAVAHDGSDKDS